MWLHPNGIHRLLVGQSLIRGDSSALVLRGLTTTRPTTCTSAYSLYCIGVEHV
jgi:hypothetical protein